MRLNLMEIASILGSEKNCYFWADPYTVPEGELSPLTIAEVNALKEKGENLFPEGAVIDSRSAKNNNIFFCLKGNQVDGHDFAFEAARKGACLIIAERNPFTHEHIATFAPRVLPAVFVVEKVETALHRLAKAHRQTSLAKVIGITGTAGKTTVKEVLMQVLSVHALTSSNLSNFNNQIGLPLSMLNASAEASFWVLEVGISKAHDMDELGSILRPDVALILNVGEGHTEGLGEKGVAHNKTKLFSYIQNRGQALFCLDYPDLVHEVKLLEPELAQKCISLHTFSTRSEVSDWFSFSCGKASFEGNFDAYNIVYDGIVEQVTAPFKGPYGAENVAAIFAAARLLGLRFEEILRGFSLAKLPEQRFSCYTEGAFVIIDDSYNANPLSMHRMLEATFVMAKEADLPMCMVLGEMRELGDGAIAAHIILGEEVANMQPAIVFWKGEHEKAMRAGLKKGKYKGQFYVVDSAPKFKELLSQIEFERGLVLFKGSRSNNLEKLLKIFSDFKSGEHGDFYAV